MKNSTPARRRIRLLVGAGSYADAASALRIARGLVSDMIADLGGLLIEEADFVAACSLPNQRVISVSGTSFIAPTPAQVRTLMNADARAFRKLLADIAEPPQAGWTFERRSGDLIECTATVGQQWDVVIVGHREIHPVHGAVVFLGTSATQNEQALALSEKLARQLDTKLLDFVVGATDAVQPLPGRFHFATLDAARTQLTHTNAQAVVIDLAHGPVRTKDDLRRLVDAARCPVVVLGVPALEPALEHAIHVPPATDHTAG